MPEIKILDEIAEVTPEHWDYLVASVEGDTTPVIAKMPLPKPADSTLGPSTDRPPVEQGIRVSDIIQAGLEAGVHPRLIRRKIASLGVRWSYSWPRHQGDSERTRRWRQMAKGMLPTICPGENCQIRVSEVGEVCNYCQAEGSGVA